MNGCEASHSAKVEHFACEPVWVRLNDTLVSPLQRYFADSTTMGLEGGYLYMVRPVGPNGVEGYARKILSVSLDAGTDPLGFGEHYWRETEVPNIPDHELGVFEYDAWLHTVSPETVLDPPNGINGQSKSASGHSTPLNKPSAASQIFMDKIPYSWPAPTPQDLGHRDYEIANETVKVEQVFWTMSSIPADLVGFHIEMAGSADGPWQRLTKHPVAWWERKYIYQGSGLFRANGYSGHPECLRFRVIAVYESGLEADPVLASTTSTATCLATPNPPTNLRASSVSDLFGCDIHLEWDAPEGTPAATEYYVYRAVMRSETRQLFFYDTQHVVGATSYTETGDDPDTDTDDPDHSCPYNQFIYHPCRVSTLDVLEAYYVTARNGTGGESPRSNLIFWKCGAAGSDGYTMVAPGNDSGSNLASARHDDSPDSLVCWNDEPAVSTPARVESSQADPSREQSRFAVAPMARLGQVVELDPPWEILDLHSDHLGSVRAITNEAGNIVSLHNYFPFGEEIAQQTSFNTHQFTGHERDKETGLDYMLARYYEAGVGRFISTDPAAGIGKSLANPQRWNEYSYAGNNPVRFYDPDGQDYVYTDPGFTAAMAFIRVSGSVTGNRVMNAFAANTVNHATGIVKSVAAWKVLDAQKQPVGVIEKNPGQPSPTKAELSAKGGQIPDLQGGASTPGTNMKSGLSAAAVYTDSQTRSSEAGMPQMVWTAKEVVHETTHLDGGSQKDAKANGEAFVEESNAAAAGVNFSPAVPLRPCSGCNARKE